MPKISTGEIGISRTTPTQMTMAGSSMLPVPRTTLASPFMVRVSGVPRKTIWNR